ncbi:PqqC-like protein [Neochlamydia sp. EPS4]|nr:PqqC-like protein [Neochlamydia sp. EPS4]
MIKNLEFENKSFVCLNCFFYYSALLNERVSMTQEFLSKIDNQIQDKHLLKHPFYQAWSRGELSKECLVEYAKEYYQHVKAFPRYLSALHSHTEDADTRRHLLNNLIEEEAGLPNHPDLWKSFTQQLGASTEEIEAHRPSPSMQAIIHTFMESCKNSSTAEGIASLYAYESQIPSICISKIKGLKEHYGMQEPSHWKYFSVHIEADKEHAAVERKLLERYANKSNEALIAASVERTLLVLWNFLSSLCTRYQLACSTSESI